MKIKVDGVLYEIVLAFGSESALAPWDAEAYSYEYVSGVRTIGELVADASGATFYDAVQAVITEITEVY